MVYWFEKNWEKDGRLPGRWDHSCVLIPKWKKTHRYLYVWTYRQGKTERFTAVRIYRTDRLVSSIIQTGSKAWTKTNKSLGNKYFEIFILLKHRWLSYSRFWAVGIYRRSRDSIKFTDHTLAEIRAQSCQVRPKSGIRTIFSIKVVTMEVSYCLDNLFRCRKSGRFFHPWWHKLWNYHLLYEI